MTSSVRISTSTLATLAIALLCLLAASTNQRLQAQTFTVLHNFSYQPDGGYPEAGLTPDINGDLYGTASLGGNQPTCEFAACGVVFKLKQVRSNWIYNLLYTFADANGTVPLAPVTIGANRTLFGSASSGGEECKPNECGVNYNLRPQASFCGSVLCSWMKRNIFVFSYEDDNNGFGSLLFDAAGNLYGVHPSGGDYGAGSVYQLVPTGGGWTENILYSFSGGQQGSNDGGTPFSGLTFDPAGNLYGTTSYGGGSQDCQGGCGTVYELTRSGSGWTEQVLYAFSSTRDGAHPWAGVIRDSTGNLYGATTFGGSGGGGTILQLSPSNGGWTLTTLHSFTGNGGPRGDLTSDGAGSLYGQTYQDGASHQGSVFKLTPAGGSWTFTPLHDFTGGLDGGQPYGNVTLDSQGNLYGTASRGGSGSCGCGVIWKMAP